MDFSQKPKPEKKIKEIDSRFQHYGILENRVALAVLRDLKDKIEELHTRISGLEEKLEGRIPENMLKNWFEQHQNTDVNNKLGFNSEIKLLHSRVSELEKKFEERIPDRVLSEAKFKEETQDSEEIIKKIISEMRTLMPRKSIIQTVQEPLTIVETKRIEKITSLLERHEKLSSSELSQLMGLSRTRCNEYFKLMDSLDLVEPVLSGREKFYRLKI